MGASSSIYENKIYKHFNCGCIYCYDSFEVQLLYCCYECLESLRNRENLKNLNIVKYEVENNSLDILLNDLEWKNKKDAMIYARKNNILLEEFISNKNILLYNFNDNIRK